MSDDELAGISYHNGFRDGLAQGRREAFEEAAKMCLAEVYDGVTLSAWAETFTAKAKETSK